MLGIRHLAAQRGAASAAVQVAHFDPGTGTALPESTAGEAMATTQSGRAAGDCVRCGPGPAVTFSVCGGSIDSSTGMPRGACFDCSSGSSSTSGGRQLHADGLQHLFAVPLESNMWGVRYHERLGEAVQAGRFQLLPAGEQAVSLLVLGCRLAGDGWGRGALLWPAEQHSILFGKSLCGGAPSGQMLGS